MYSNTAKYHHDRSDWLMTPAERAYYMRIYSELRRQSQQTKKNETSQGIGKTSYTVLKYQQYCCLQHIWCSAY